MKKIYVLVSVFSLFSHFAFASGCVIDSNNTIFFAPRPDSLPCAERGVGYNQVIQIKIPTSIDLQQFGFPISFVLTIDSVVFDSLTGLPNGITYLINPASGHLMGGQNACASIYGTTNDLAGNYPIIFHGRMSLHGIPFPPYFSGDTTVDLAAVQASPQNPFNASLDVIEQGAPCRASTTIRDFSADLNSLINVYPNPSNGNFEFRLNAGRRITGEMAVTDMTGRKIFTEQLDVTGSYSKAINISQFGKGLYQIQLKTAEGFAAKNISVE